jgi:hypothetical protein
VDDFGIHFHVKVDSPIIYQQNVGGSGPNRPHKCWSIQPIIYQQKCGTGLEACYQIKINSRAENCTELISRQPEDEKQHRRPSSKDCMAGKISALCLRWPRCAL